jgi:lactoylglutathione lyase
MISITHIALYCSDLEKMRSFYEYYFEAKSNEKYVNEKKGFESYFLSFESGAALELMTKTGIVKANEERKEFLGFTHFACSVGSEEMVNKLTEKLRKDGFEIAGECRWTGDGFYESIVLDPEGNRIEITV